ncbi:transcriptional regulator [Natrinema sp. DC36]|uniref:transcriptional regulator n=1 Tax=Natrinema sp. DC36 TaxID=2878680 RepID=UPI001CF0B30A|nr:transcriptional regulator [Natrinema sp. DC36]
MTTVTVLDQFARDIASVIPQIDTTAEHRRWQPGIGAFDEKVQIERILEHLEQQSTHYADTRTEVRYPNSDQRCDIILDRDGVQIPIEAKLLRFYRDNGDLEPAAYSTVYSLFSNSLVADAQKLAASEFETSRGLLGLYYEPADEVPSSMDAPKLAEKVTRDVDYWYDLTLTTQTIAEFTDLRHPVHQQGAVITWELTE